jgi:Fur family iron response transcriptional regulator
MNESRSDDPQFVYGQPTAEIVAVNGEAREHGDMTNGVPDGAGPPRDALAHGRNGCPWHDVQALLRQVKLRPTRQRMALGWLLFARGGRHLTAEMLYEEAGQAKIAVSLATIYNTLHQFTNAGLLREVSVNGSKTYFDTNVSDHHHFFVENEHNLIDIPAADDIIGKLPDVPEGYEISRVDVVVRLRRKRKV